MNGPRASGWKHIWQVKNESLRRMNELEEMREKVEGRKLVMQNLSLRTKVVVEDAKRKEEGLAAEVRSLLVAGTALSVARKRLQVPLSTAALLYCLVLESFVQNL